MTSPYTPVPTVFSGTITEPVDGEPRTVASVTQMTRKLADGLADVTNKAPVRKDIFLVNGTWTAPAGCTYVDLEMVGGGAGGGGGMGGSTATPTTAGACGGGGGGGARKVRSRITVVPGVVYAVTIGAGGAGGTNGTAAGVLPGVGSDGGDTLFDTLAIARGAQGGSCGQAVWAGVANQYGYVQGGADVKGAAPIATFGIILWISTVDRASHFGGQGGFGTTVLGTPATDGRSSPEGFPGGAPGAAGAIATYRSGGGGGGGGAGPYGAGAAGGVGGASNAGGTGSAGITASAGVANTGAGGGGGGSGGMGNVAGGIGGTGGNGGSGKLIVCYDGLQAVVT